MRAWVYTCQLCAALFDVFDRCYEDEMHYSLSDFSATILLYWMYSIAMLYKWVLREQEEE